MRQIVLDTETTGLSTEEGHRIIEIGCVELVNRRYTGRNFHYYINPGREIDVGALQIHGITSEFLANKPFFHAIADELMTYLRGAELIIHNAPFDTGFLDYELQMIGKDFKPLNHYCSVVDTLLLARQKHPGQQNSLDALCKRYSVDNISRELHGALLDARLLADVYLAMTGGQTSLFGETSQMNNQPKFVAKTSEQRLPLLILPANPDEEAAHTAFLEAINKASGGKVMWE